MSTSIKIGSYWNNEGKYQAQYNKAWEQLIPAQGEAEDGLPEALRAISRIGYDYYNNGFCNAHVHETDDYGESTGNVELDSYYQDMLDYLQSHIPYTMWKTLDSWILEPSYGNIDWGNNGDDIIDRIIDHIMEGIIKAELITETETA